MARVRDSSRGITIAALIVAANFAVVLQITGISYGRFQWAQFAGAYNPTATPTTTPTTTPTATPTPLPNGAGCASGTQCASTFCADSVCCNSACDQPGQACDLPGQQGVCRVPAPAPALGGGGLAVAVVLLMVVGALTLRASRRRDRTAR